ncbi:protein ARABIDILLO 1 isoform X2 [Canna indica]|uniref:Protein ARABIDILLO 1 isoform X2 n=1 Tax=Canna indica TaxID=4628 RepID=A0AAQ3KBA9_9LILI|nr:protein ARABIDILLO 1 isoform X2 [Canna indica]
MSRRVRRRVAQSKDKEKAAPSLPYSEAAEQCEILRPGGSGVEAVAKAVAKAAAVDWTALPDDTVVQIFSRLNYRDRSCLASTCHSWRVLGSSSCLWASLDLRAHRLNVDTAAALAGRCAHLRRLRFEGSASASALISLQARGLREIAGDYCRDITDATLSVIAARHEALEYLQIGPDPCVRITSDAVRHVAMCCARLRRLRLSGIREVNGDAINAFARHCPQLAEIAFFDCGVIDEAALERVVSLRFLSVAGSRNLKWTTASLSWSNLPNLVGVDVSRTDVSASAVSRLLSISKNLKVLCALNCVALEEERSQSPNAFIYPKGRLLISETTDIFRGIASLFGKSVMKEHTFFAEWRNLQIDDKNLSDTMNWLEWIISHSLLRIAQSSQHGMDEFWLRQGAVLLLSLVKSSQEDVQEKAATGLATFVVTDDENATVEPARAEAVMRNGGIPLLLELAKSCQEGVQSEAAKAIANLSVNSKVAKAVADEGGIRILADLARSSNRLVAEEAAGGLWNLSVGEEHKATIADAGGVKALVNLIFKWKSGVDGVLERAAGALANLAADDKCSVEIAMAGGVHALVVLAKSCNSEGVQEQAARALANLAAHGDSNSNNAAVGQEAGALEALVQLTYSQNEGVRQEAAGALWNLSFDDRNREAIALAGGVEALVDLAHACANASHGLQERAAGALWGLSVSEANSIAIGREGGVAPLIALARSEAEDVHETAAGALWNLAFNSGNALRIIEEGGVPTLVHLCSSSGSKMARFMAALALAYMFDGRMDEVALVGSSLEGSSKSVNLDGARRMALKHIETFVLTFSDPQVLSNAAASSAPAALAQVADAARIQEAGHLRCSASEIGRYVTMLRNPSSVLRACAAFALLQFTLPGGRHATHHSGLLQKAGAARVLRGAAAAATAPIEAKIFARIVLRNLEHHQLEAST